MPAEIKIIKRNFDANYFNLINLFLTTYEKFIA